MQFLFLFFPQLVDHDEADSSNSACRMSDPSGLPRALFHIIFKNTFSTVTDDINRGTGTYWHTVWDRLFRLCPNFGQHPPFFSKMRTFFKNRPPWYKFYSNSPLYHGDRFLHWTRANKTHTTETDFWLTPKQKKFFFLQGFCVRSVGGGKLFV